MESSIKDLREELQGKAHIVAINTDHPENISFTQDFGVRVVPTLVFMDKDTNITQVVEGYISKTDMYQYLLEAGVE